MKIKVLLSLYLVLIQVTYSQKSLLKQANVNYELGKFHTALNQYTRVLAKNPKDSVSRYKECICLYQLSRFSDAQSCFQYLTSHHESFPSSLNYFLAKTFKSENELDSAIKYFDIYVKQQASKNPQTEAYLSGYKELQSTIRAKEQIDREIKSASATLLGNGINSEYPDYGPLISEDEKLMIFTSCRPETKGGVVEENDGRYHEDIYMSIFNDTLKKWNKAKALSEINTVANDAAVFLSHDGKKMIIYRHDPYNHLNQNFGDLYETNFINGAWTVPVNLDGINSKFWEASATMSQDGKTLIFSSNRPGGYGGMDLYISRKNESGKWGIPQNITRLNTEYDEDSPYIHPNGKTLYFSSKGYNSIGGYDVFFSHFNVDMNVWSAPEHLPYPISTTNDDLYFSWNKKGTHAYISTYKHDGIGDKDIYKVVFHDDLTDLVIYSGIMKDSLSTLSDVQIFVENLTNKDMIESYADKQGGFKVILKDNQSYKFTFKKEGYKIHQTILDLRNLAENHRFDHEIIVLQKE